MHANHTPENGEGDSFVRSFTGHYLETGFHFVRIPKQNGKPSKAPTLPGWNLPKAPDNPHGYTNILETAAAWLQAGDNIGLALVPSGVVSLDIDNLEETRRVFTGVGMALEVWFADPHRVEIRSGKPGKAKLLFRVPAGVMPQSRKLNFGTGKNARSIFEIRHGSTDGRTVQDVLPPSIHPDTGKPYELMGDILHMPGLPPELLALWQTWPDVLKTFDPAYEPPKQTTRHRHKKQAGGGQRDAIAEFNDAHDLESVLERHGYRRKGKRYLRPGSESGIPGLTLLDGKGGQPLCYSHGGDDLNDGHAHDAFDVYRILDCGGDWKKALGWNSEITEHNQRLFKQAPHTKLGDENVSDVSAFEPNNHASQTFGQNDTPSDPLQDLPAKLADDPFYPFQADVLRALVLLEETDAHAWNKVKAELKAGNIVLRDLAAAMAKTRAKLKEERQAEAERKAREQRAGRMGSRVGQYEVMYGAIHRWKETPDGDIPVRLCNFDARIVGEVMRDDGASVESYFVVEGARSNGVSLGKAEVAFSDFAPLAWVTRAWGNLACIEAGVSNRDHLRAAIQQLSGEVPRRTIYGHTGWRSLDSEWRYLHGAGALCVDGNRSDIEVDAGAGHMLRYILPVPMEDIREAVRASLGLLDIAPQNQPVGATLLCAAYRAPLAECVSIDVSLFLGGQTGAMKSETSALALQHFGADFSARAVPGNWTDTPTDLEMKAHAAKDALFIIDDFKPNGRPKNEADRMHSLADRIFRGVGNGAGRGRRTANLKQRPDYPARGFVIASGEDLPKGQSCRARLVIVEVRRGDVDKAKLTELQKAGRSGLLAQAMAGYIQWLAPQLPELKVTLKDRLIAERDAAIQAGLNGDHDRVPDNVAQLLVGAHLLTRFAADVGAVGDADALFERIKAAIYQTAAAQGEHLADQDEVNRFFALLGAALSSRRVHVADLHTQEEPLHPQAWGWKVEKLDDGMGFKERKTPGGNLVGWIDGDKLYLESDAAFAAVVMMARDQGESFSITQNSLWKRFADKGLLQDRKQDIRKDGTVYVRLKTERRIGGKKYTTLVCVDSKILAGIDAEKFAETAETTQPEATDAGVLGCLRTPENNGDGAETATKSGDRPADGADLCVSAFCGDSELGGDTAETAESQARRGFQDAVSAVSAKNSQLRPAEVFENNTHMPFAGGDSAEAAGWTDTGVVRCGDCWNWTPPSGDGQGKCGRGVRPTPAQGPLCRSVPRYCEQFQPTNTSTRRGRT